LRVSTGQIDVRLSLARRIAEVAPAVDHLFARAAADPESQPSPGDEVGCARIRGELLGGDREVDGLRQDVGSRTREGA